MEHATAFDNRSDLAGQLTELGRMVSQLDAMEAQITRTQFVPGEVAYRDPHDSYHHIALGAVLAAHHLSAHHARRLDGLLSLPLEGDWADDDVLEEWAAKARALELTVGEGLVLLLEMMAGNFERHGRYAEWRRALERYVARTEAFFTAVDDDIRGAMVRKPPSPKQLTLVRYTCECRRLEYPALPNRLAAFEWLRDAAANPRYREMQP